MPKMTDNLNGTVRNWTCPSSKWRGPKSPFFKIWWSLINYYVFRKFNFVMFCLSSYRKLLDLQPLNPANNLTLQNSLCSIYTEILMKKHVKSWFYIFKLRLISWMEFYFIRCTYVLYMLKSLADTLNMLKGSKVKPLFLNKEPYLSEHNGLVDPF